MGVDRLHPGFEPLVTPSYQETAPSPDLRDLVACNWRRVVGFEGEPSRSPVIPDGCADIMVFDDAPPRVAGPDAVTRWVTIPSGTSITAVRLRPGAVRAVLGCDAGSIVGGSALLSDLAPGARALHERLLATASPRPRQALLEAWVRTALARNENGDRGVVAACRLLTADPDLEIGALARRFDWSARAIHRLFRGACGYGPKHFQRIMRLQQAVRAAQGTARLADVAQAAGYADQAHMTRDFRDLTGFTPKGYLAIARPGLGAWIDEDW